MSGHEISEVGLLKYTQLLIISLFVLPPIWPPFYLLFIEQQPYCFQKELSEITFAFPVYLRIILTADLMRALPHIIWCPWTKHCFYFSANVKSFLDWATWAWCSFILHWSFLILFSWISLSLCLHLCWNVPLTEWSSLMLTITWGSSWILYSFHCTIQNYLSFRVCLFFVGSLSYCNT